jgi:polyphosphate kinase
MVRVGGLKLVDQQDGSSLDIAGMTASEQLSAITKRIREMYATQVNCLNELEAELSDNGIIRLRPDELSEVQRDFLARQFSTELSAAAAPLAVENNFGFPMLSGTRLCLCVKLNSDDHRSIKPALKHKATKPVDLAEAENDNTEPAVRYALVPLGRSLKRIWTVPGSESFSYMYLEEVFGMFLSEMFGGQEILEWAPFRVTRNGDVEIDEDSRSDLMIDMQEMLKVRETSQCVRLEISASASESLTGFLCDALDISLGDVYGVDGPLAMKDLFAICGMKGFNHLKDVPWPPQPVAEMMRPGDLFEKIAIEDRLLIHPYQSYDPVVDFVRAAATDPQVIAIKQTLYRTSENSAIASALEEAAVKGKHVSCIVELKARFDEARNIQWAKRLELAGVDVIYGIQGLKTHAKVCIVVRKETTGIRRYVHFGTGNYNESTARLYSDISLFTCDEQLGMDAIHFFNAITGLSVPQSLGKLSAAPINLRETILEMISIEIENKRKEGSGLIIAKLNSLVDKEIIDALYAASQEGVEIKLNIRGICCLLPGKKGLSENITVISVVDRLLEHARVLYFHHGGDDRVFISSADWMGRNLDRRVELLVPVEHDHAKGRLIRMLNTYFDDNTNASILNDDGTYQQVEYNKKKKRPVRSQEMLYQEAHQMYQAHSDPRTTVFESIRKPEV